MRSCLERKIIFDRLKDIFVFCFCFLCLTSLFYPGICTAQRRQADITAGVLLDLSGPGSSIGVAAYTAIRLAADDINSQGGIKGRRIRIAVFDTKGEKNLLLSGARRLQHEQGAMVLLGPTARSNVPLLRRYAESSKIPVILIQGQEPILKFRNMKTTWTFSTALNFKVELKALFSYFREKHYETLGGLINNTTSSSKIRLWIKGYATEYGMKISCLGSFNPNMEDLSLKLKYLSRCEPDMAILWGDWKTSSLVHANLKRIDIPLAVTHELFFKDPSALELPVGSLIYAVVPPVLFWQQVPTSSPSFFLIKRFIESWGTDFQELTIRQQLAAGQAWDGLRLACRAISFAHGLDHRAIKSSLEERVANFAGVTGTFSPDKQNHSGLKARSLLLLRCTGSRWSLVNNR